jgi:hypothetical protein
MGDATTDIRSGDIVVVPPGARHGFVGTGPTGFWALSIQFEGTGLYEDPDNARVSFVGDRADIATIRAENDKYMRAYEGNALVRLIRDIDTQPVGVRESLLDHLQGWSNAFQRIIAARVVGEGDSPARALADEHLTEEVGHHRLLAAIRDGRDVPWDPVIAGVSSWFLDRMATGSSVERTVLAHLALEGSGMIFHAAGVHAFASSEYFRLHDGADAEHLEMGYRELSERRDWTVEQVSAALRQGWQMMELLCDRIADRARSAALADHVH